MPPNQLWHSVKVSSRAENRNELASQVDVRNHWARAAAQSVLAKVIMKEVPEEIAIHSPDLYPVLYTMLSALLPQSPSKN
jgi:hypothetical protein